MKKLVILSTILLFLTSLLAGCEATLPEYIQSIEIEQKSVMVEIGEKEALKIKIKPERVINKDLVMSSLDDSVATINGVGEVVGLKVGKTEVTVKAKKGGVNINIPVTVVEKDAIPISITNDDIDVVKDNNGNCRIYIKSNENTKKIKENTELNFFTANSIAILKIGKRETEILQVVELCFDSSYLNYTRGNGQQFALDLTNNKSVEIDIKSSYNIVKHTVINAK